MTIDTFVQTYNGKIVRGGQCGELVRQFWIDVDKTTPPSYTNSKDYWPNPVPGYDKITSNPQPGNIAIYDGHGAFPEGHSAIYVGNGQVFEQNADPNGSPAHLFPRANTYLLGYLSKKGGSTMPTLTSEAIDMAFKMAGQDSKAGDYTYYADKPEELIRNLWGSSGSARWSLWGHNPLPAPGATVSRETVIQYVNKYLT